jgi:hypothetical protein
MNALEIHRTENTDAAWDYLIESGIATENELILVTSLNGYRYETLCDVLFVRTGDRYFGQNEDEDEDEDEN